MFLHNNCILNDHLLSFGFESLLEEDKARIEINDNTSNPNTAYVQGQGEVCKFYLKGTCSKGPSCPFKHAKGERTVVCKHWLRGLCKKGDQCEFLHEYDLSKMPECYFFSRFGECSNPECIYLHINPEDKIRECPWYARGFCKHGSKCRHKHVKRTACSNYLRGFCPEGSLCIYGHPKYELPKEEGFVDGNAMNAMGRRARTPMICHKCGSVGHKAATCTAIASRDPHEDRPPPRPLENVTCFKCGQLGHYANKCTNRKVQPPAGGYPAQAQFFGGQNQMMHGGGGNPQMQMRQQIPPRQPHFQQSPDQQMHYQMNPQMQQFSPWQ